MRDLKAEMTQLEVIERESTDPFNPDNFQEELGLYFKDMIEWLKVEQENNPKQTKEEYLERLDEYMNGNVLPISFNDFVEPNSELYYQLFDLIKLGYNQEDGILSLEMMKYLESQIAESDLVPDVYKSTLLSYSSVMKQVRANTELIQLIVQPEIAWQQGYNYADCFDAHFDHYMMERTGVLVDIDSPASMIASWAGLPWTLASAIVDSAIDAHNDCKED